MTTLHNLSPVAKFMVALVGTAAAAAEAGLVNASYAKWIAVGIFFLSTLGVYEVRNEAT